MPYMNDVMNLLEKATRIAERLQTANKDSDCNLVIDDPEVLNDFILKAKEMLAEHKALQVGHLARM
jgi:hypothetical protein